MGALFAVAAFGVTPHAKAQPSPETAAHEVARARYVAGDFSGALAELSSAYERTHDPRMLWNMAACEKKLSRFDRVQTHLRRYLVEGADVLTAEDKARAQALIAEAHAFTSDITFDVAPAGASIELDGLVLDDTARSEGLPVLAGTHSVRVRNEGFVERTYVFRAVPPQPFQVKLELEVAPSPPSSPQPAPPFAPADAAPEPARSGRNAWPWVIGGAGVAALGAGAYFGVRALEDADARDQSALRTHAWLADIGLGAGIVGLGVALYLGLTQKGAAPAKQAVAHVAPSVSPRGAGILVSW